MKQTYHMIDIATYGQLSQQNHLLKFRGTSGSHKEMGKEVSSELHSKNPTPVTRAFSSNALGVLAFPRAYPRSWPGTGPALQHVSSSALSSVRAWALEQCLD